MPSKQVVDRQKEAQAVLSAGTTHAAEMVKRLATLFTPLLQRGEKPPDFELVVELLLRGLQQSLTEMIAADDAYQAELLDDAEPRLRRDEAAAALRQRLIDLRDTLGAVFGAATVQSCGFGAATPEDATQLGRFASGVSQALSEVVLPKPRLLGLTLSAKQVTAELDGLQKLLAQALSDVSRESREAQAALALRNATQARFDVRYTAVANVLVGLLRLTDQPELADRVRLTWRRSTAEQDAAEPGVPVPPADPAPKP